MTSQAIAIVEYARKERGFEEWCRLRPAYVADGDRWKPVPTDSIKEQFPREGRLYWFHPKPVSIGSIWLVTYAASTLEDADQKPDRFVVEEGYPLPLLVRRGTPTDDVALRRSIEGATISFPSPLPCPIYIKVPSAESHWVGPITVNAERSEDGRYHIKRAPAEGFMDVHEVANSGLQIIEFGRQEVMTLAPKRLVGESVGAFNIQSDDALLDSALKRIRKLNPQVADGLQVTKAVYASYVDALSAADLVGKQAQYEGERTRALGLLIGQMEDLSLDASSVAEALLSLPMVEARISEAIALKTQEVSDKIRLEAQSAQKQAIESAKKAENQLIILSEQTELARTEAASLQTRVEALRTESRTIPLRLEQAMKEAARSFQDDPGTFLGQSIIAHQLAQYMFSPDVAHRNHRIPDYLKPAIEFNNIRDMATCCSLHAKEQSVDHEMAISAAAMLMHGCTLVLFGAASEAMVAVIGKCLAGGNMLRFPVPSNVFSLADLRQLEAVDSITLEPLGLTFGEAILDPDDSKFLCILTGIDRAPLEVTLADFLMPPLASNVDKRKRPRIVTTMRPGPSTFRIPHTLRAHLGLVPCKFTYVANALDGEPAPTFAPALGWTVDAPRQDLSPDIHRLVTEVGIASSTAGSEIDWISAGLDDSRRGLAAWMTIRLAGLVKSATLVQLIETHCGLEYSRPIAASNMLRDADALMQPE